MGVYEKRNFDAVTDFIVKEIIGGRIVPITEVQSIYGLDTDKRSYENLLKQRINRVWRAQ